MAADVLATQGARASAAISKSFLMEDDDLFVPYSWWPGDSRSQGIRNNGKLTQSEHQT